MAVWSGDSQGVGQNAFADDVLFGIGMAHSRGSFPR